MTIIERYNDCMLKKSPKVTSTPSPQKKYVLDVVPLDKLPPETPDFFSYYGDASIGSLIDVTMRNHKKQGFVIGSKSIQQSKAYLKKSTFSLKSISGVVHAHPIVSHKQIAFAHWLKTYAYISLPHALELLTSFRTKIIGTDIGINMMRVPLKKVRKKFKTYWSKDIPQKFLDHLPALLITPKEEFIPFLKQASLVIKLTLGLVSA